MSGFACSHAAKLFSNELKKMSLWNDTTKHMWQFNHLNLYSREGCTKVTV